MLSGAAEPAVYMQIVDGKFRDDRWTADGRWDLNKFKTSAGEIDWDKVRSHLSGCCGRRVSAPAPSHPAPSSLPKAARRPPLTHFDYL